MAVTLNGRRVDWVSMHITLPSIGQVSLTVSSLTLPNVTRSKTHVYGSGSKNIGYTLDSVKIEECSMTILLAEADEIISARGSVLGGLPFPIVMSYYDEGLSENRTDVYTGCLFTAYQPNIAQGNEPATAVFKFLPDDMTINGYPVIPVAA